MPFPDGFPEGNFRAVHCRICGAKNRQDAGWRYRGPHKTTPEAEQVTEARLMQQPSDRFTLSSAALNTYECSYCRTDKNAPKPHDPEREALHRRQIQFMLAALARDGGVRASDRIIGSITTASPQSMGDSAHAALPRPNTRAAAASIRVSTHRNNSSEQQAVHKVYGDVAQKDSQSGSENENDSASPARDSDDVARGPAHDDDDPSDVGLDDQAF
jgi:hypothetical protein